MTKTKTFKQYLTENLPPNLRTWEGVLAIALVLFAGVIITGTPAILYPFHRQLELSIGGEMFVLFATGVCGWILTQRGRFRLEQAEISEQEVRVVAAEQQVTTAQVFPDFLKDQLRLSAERGRLLMLRAEVRANRLYSIGTVLTVLSVLAPIGAIAVYASIQPLPAETLNVLRSLRGTNGLLPSGISVSVQRDWHILLSGISFGFLFLAAAGAIFGQHRRQMETVLTLGRDVDYYNSLVGAVEIATRADDAKIRGGLQHVTGAVMTEFLRRPAANGQAISETEPSTQLEQMLALLRAGASK
jgi:hypothetical protein